MLYSHQFGKCAFYPYQSRKRTRNCSYLHGMDNSVYLRSFKNRVCPQQSRVVIFDGSLQELTLRWRELFCAMLCSPLGSAHIQWLQWYTVHLIYLESGHFWRAILVKLLNSLLHLYCSSTTPFIQSCSPHSPKDGVVETIPYIQVSLSESASLEPLAWHPHALLFLSLVHCSV